MSTPDKLIVSNSNELSQKYKAAGRTAIEKALKNLIKADAAPGDYDIKLEKLSP